MHSDLSSHLHTEECNILIRKLRECHDQNKLAKFLGACNEVDRQLTKCLKQEREDRRRQNYLRAQERNSRNQNSSNN